MNSFYDKTELQKLGLRKFGENVLISRKCSIYTPEAIKIGDNVRVDDFCILSGSITLGSQIHVGAYSALYGKNEIIMKDYSGLSPRCTVFSAIDDFSGNFLISPMVPQKFTNIIGGPVIFNNFSQIGAGSVVLPDVIIGEGTAVGAMSLVNKSLGEWGIYAGIPVKWIKERERRLLEFIERSL